uniref:NADH dehydrogenase subunit 6 n=1 Tax=Macridiscus multifarius TaxID=1408811 RepID=A0A6C0RV86_9BIVA|nr:NADH dehydrogenase subunit 6 [Macridiscus multifarius]QIA44510.1 NADH dehydrogenase subunit 6 [Macridiscus multifarius]
MMVVLSLSSFSVLMKYNHPMYYGMGWVCLVVNISAMLSLYSGVYGFVLFMSVVSGVLVVFAYSMSLSPLMLNKEEAENFVTSKGMVKREGMSSVFFKRVSILFIVSILFTSLFISMLGVVPKVSSSWFLSVLYMSTGWSLGMVLLSLFMFLVMIFCVSVAGKFKGALIK